MSKFELSCIYWYGFWMLLAFAVPELWSAFDSRAPIYTLSTTTQDVEGLWVWACLPVLLGLLVLNIHLVGRFLPALYREITG